MTAQARTAPRFPRRPVAAPSINQTAMLSETTRAGRAPKGGIANAPTAPAAIDTSRRRQPEVSMIHCARCGSGPVALPGTGAGRDPAPSKA